MATKKTAKKVNLRAKNTADITKTTLKKALARTRDLIQYFLRAKAEKINLNTFCEGGYATPTVINCGTPSCLGGHAVLRYAPKEYSVTHDGDLRDERGNSVDFQETAENLLRTDIYVSRGIEFAITSMFKGFRAVNGGHASHRQEALYRLRVHEAALLAQIAVEAAA